MPQKGKRKMRVNKIGKVSFYRKPYNTIPRNKNLLETVNTFGYVPKKINRKRPLSSNGRLAPVYFSAVYFSSSQWENKLWNLSNSVTGYNKREGKKSSKNQHGGRYRLYWVKNHKGVHSEWAFSLFAFAWKPAGVNISPHISRFPMRFHISIPIRTDTQIKYGDSKYLCDNRIAI